MRLHLGRRSMKSALQSLLLGLVAGASGALTITPLDAMEPLAQRIAHTDLDKFAASSSHGGVRTRINHQLLDRNALGVNLNFLIRGRMPPGSGIGHHFHNTCEEMLFILDGEAEFTVDGRTPLIKGPAGAPSRVGHSHGLTKERLGYATGFARAANLAASQPQEIRMRMPGRTLTDR